MNHVDNLASWVESVIIDFIDNCLENTLGNPTNEKAFETPLVGFSNGADPLYERYKEHVGPFHWTSWEIFTKTFPGIQVKSDELTVISWILPQTKATKADNRKQTFYPAERWARARIFGEEVNVKLRNRLAHILTENGFETVAPMTSPHWEAKTSDQYGFASTWSERHAAYASGLGTFGLCDGLITPKGKAMRAGSVVSRIKIPVTQRPYEDHHAYCLFYAKGTCRKCIERCPVGAISENGHDKEKCSWHLHPTTADFVKSRYGFDGYGCGLCQTGVPCESRIPLKEDSPSNSP